jgi:hypothetical protein
MRVFRGQWVLTVVDSRLHVVGASADSRISSAILARTFRANADCQSLNVAEAIHRQVM